ncbi:myosin-Ia [Thecamonas trahens ATCC 50062]|uniref:Myosin-Ia n=1 Tax=Thecamonas trahens ATCC 50062 TaxID=461836 RepID=A0A0L0D5F8_THETB|nr:myosin-Ia [Thecamonas trahens ATCC 50062]KNC47564.1 myosin-Ia [Thecamonas trahens ATCC 50062]|eukprot:XP_013759496.1 myosin-Ia [Thecamonas trahens ATCC 50062]
MSQEPAMADHGGTSEAAVAGPAGGCVAVHDLVLLDKADVPTVAKTLEQRFVDGAVYTCISSVVLAVNPFRRPDGLYGPSVMEGYFGKAARSQPPHIYALANDAYHAMLETNVSQTIIISGESGAGKTESSRICMHFIAAVSGNRAADVDSVKDSLLGSNPILEAFGNAQTLRNDNSSRFGKFMEIQFDARGSPLGGCVSVYLLEKSRVVRPAPGERSFHAFYFMLAGAPPELRAELDLNHPPEFFPSLARSGTYTVPSIDDAAGYAELVAAMTTLGFPADSQTALFRLLAAVLHLSRVSFVAAAGSKGDVASVADGAVLADVARLLGVSADGLGKALTSHTIETRGEAINIPLSPERADDTRDSLGAALYDAMFSHIVTLINASISSPAPAAASIGVLDIYGFEILHSNTFEQFCINYTNEKLQKLFIDLTLSAEQAEYAAEGIAWVPVDYFDNGVICELIEGRGGVFDVLDEETVLPKTSDTSFVAKLEVTKPGSSPYFALAATHRALKLPRLSFRVEHYAGFVEYTAVSFLEKNKTKTYPDFASLLAASSEALHVCLAPALGAGSTSASSRRGVRKRAATTVSVFKRQLASLIQTLTASHAHYIRCIKPNDERSPTIFDFERVEHQIQYLGLLENVRVARAGFCFREPVDSFVARYKMLAQDSCWPHPTGLSLPQAVHAILAARGIDKSQYQMGKTKVFVKDPASVFALEDARTAALPRLVTLIQAWWRGVATRAALAAAAAATTIATAWRAFVARRFFVEHRAAVRIARAWRSFGLRAWCARALAASTIARAWRCSKAREARRHQLAARDIQRTARGFLARTAVARTTAASRIGAICRGRYVRAHIDDITAEARAAKERARQDAAAAAIQAQVRGLLARRAYARARAATKIQAAWRGHVQQQAYIKRRAGERVASFVLRVALERRFARAKAVTHIAAAWRGRVARLAFKRLMAARKLQKWIRALWAVQLLSGIEQALASLTPKVWPDAVVDGAQEDARATLYHMYLAWRARVYRDACTETKRIAMWRRVRASEMFKASKAKVYAASVQLAFAGDALGLGTAGSKSARELAKAMAKVGDESSIIFSAPIAKVNRSFKHDENAVALSRRHLFRLKGKSFKVKSVTPIEAISSLSCSPFGDCYMVLTFDGVEHHDMVFACERLVEFAVRLLDQLQAVTEAGRSGATSHVAAASRMAAATSHTHARVEFGDRLVFQEPKGEYVLLFDASSEARPDGHGGGYKIAKIKGAKNTGKVVVPPS